MVFQPRRAISSIAGSLTSLFSVDSAPASDYAAAGDTRGNLDAPVKPARPVQPIATGAKMRKLRAAIAQAGARRRIRGMGAVILMGRIMMLYRNESWGRPTWSRTLSWVQQARAGTPGGRKARRAKPGPGVQPAAPRTPRGQGPGVQACPASARSAQNAPNSNMRQFGPSFRQISGDRPERVTFGMKGVDPLDRSLLLIDRHELAVRADRETERHRAAAELVVGLLPMLAGADALADPVALEFSERRDDGEEQPRDAVAATHRRRRRSGREGTG